jgi:hypothetical protein
MPIVIRDINLGGLADSNYQGAANSYAESVGLDIHSAPGLIKVNQKLTKNSGTTVTEFCKWAVSCSNGETYWFSADSGKIWGRTSAGTWALRYTTSAAAGESKCLGAMEFNGYIYWATQSRLHRIDTTSALTADWTGVAANWATFTNTDASYHPMWEVNLSLYIGDKNYVAAVLTDVTQTGAFSANVLDLPANDRITALNSLATDLLIGTTRASSVNECKFYRWNTWSPSWFSEDWVPEVAINAFIPIDNGVLVSAGTKGNLYVYNGSTLEPVKTIKGDYDGSTNKNIVYANSVLNFHGLPLFGVSNVSGNPSLEGIYSFGSHNRNYKPVLNLEYISSQNVTSAIEYGAMAGNGDTFLVAWKDSTGTPAYGVDLLDVSNKYSGAYLITRVLMPDRDNLTSVGHVNVGYKQIPTNTAISISKYVNHGSVTSITSAVDAKTHTQKALVDVGDATTLQIKVSMTASSNTAPEIEAILINV